MGRPTGLKSTGVAVGIAVAFGMGAVGTQAAYGSDGKRLFEAQCAQCHSPREVMHWGRSRPDPDARAEWLDRFLKRHYPPADNERPMIIQHIQDLIAAGEGKK